MAVRFNNLVSLLGDMEKKGWIIDSFPFSYNGVSTIVVITRFHNDEAKPSKYAKIKVYFVLRQDSKENVKAWADLWNVHFASVDEFCRFWQIHRNGNYSDLFNNFDEYFANHIPKTKIENKSDDVERRILGGYAEGNNPLAIYCYDVRRNGRSSDGTPNNRSMENSNKARVLRPQLYSIYQKDKNLSFFFSVKPEDEKTDKEIMCQFASR